MAYRVPEQNIFQKFIHWVKFKRVLLSGGEYDTKNLKVGTRIYQDELRFKKDICITCNGKGSWVSKKGSASWKAECVALDISIDAQQWIQDITSNCTDCKSTGKESIRQQWAIDRLDPSKHTFVIWCDNKAPCWECGKMKNEHI